MYLPHPTTIPQFHQTKKTTLNCPYPNFPLLYKYTFFAFLPMKQKIKPNYLKRTADAIFLIILIYFSFQTIFNYSRIDYALMPHSWYAPLNLFHNFNLIFHELFHVVFMPFGEFMHFLGGTLGEFVFPIIFLVYFIIKLNLRGVAFSMWWIGFNLIGTSVYMRDALELRLPLLNDGSVHDWLWIFGRTGWITRANFTANVTLGIGVVIILTAILGYLGYMIIKTIDPAKRD